LWERSGRPTTMYTASGPWNGDEHRPLLTLYLEGRDGQLYQFYHRHLYDSRNQMPIVVRKQTSHCWWLYAGRGDFSPRQCTLRRRDSHNGWDVRKMSSGVTRLLSSVHQLAAGGRPRSRPVVGRLWSHDVRPDHVHRRQHRLPNRLATDLFICL